MSPNAPLVDGAGMDGDVVPGNRARRAVLRAALLTGVVGSMTACLGTREEVYDVRDFGASGTGEIDDAEAFRAAIAELEGRPGTVHVPDGTYALGQDPGEWWCLGIPSGVMLSGPGTLAFHSSVERGTRLINLWGAETGLEGLALDLSGAPEGFSFGVTVDKTAERVMIRGLNISGNPHRGGIQVLGGEDITITACNISNVKWNGVTLYGRGDGNGPNGVLIRNCNISSDAQAVDCEPVEGAKVRGLRIIDCRMTSQNNYALTLSHSMSAYVSSTHLRGALYMTKAEGAHVKSCIIDAQSLPDKCAIEMSYDSLDCRVDGCNINGNSAGPVIRARVTDGQAPSRVSIRNSKVVRGGASHHPAVLMQGCDGAAIAHNVISGGVAGVGIKLRNSDQTIKRPIVVGNTITDTDIGILINGPEPSSVPGVVCGNNAPELPSERVEIFRGAGQDALRDCGA